MMNTTAGGRRRARAPDEAGLSPGRKRHTRISPTNGTALLLRVLMPPGDLAFSRWV